MSIQVEFTFSDLIAGYVTSFDSATDIFGIKTTDDREFQAKLTATSYAKLVQNLGEPYPDATSSMRSMLVPARYLFTYGVFYPDKTIFEAKQIVFVSRQVDNYIFEKSNWWVDQILSLANFLSPSPIW
ncbi:MAG: hypothetical protein MGG11_10515 [Trichodesmium sp. MAG_R03]|nr:hypothetical protein [Trichodesmium sp. MAG_R03]